MDGARFEERVIGNLFGGPENFQRVQEVINLPLDCDNARIIDVLEAL